jgi:hypothetical protein
MELFGNIMILKAQGKLSYDGVVEAIKQHYPKATYHVVWDLSNSSISEMTKDDFKQIPAVAKQYLPNRTGGMTAYVSNSMSDFGMLRMYTVYAEMAEMPYGYRVYKSMKEALEWLERN